MTTTHALSDQKQAMQSVVIARLGRTLNLVLDRQNHRLGIGNRELFHTGKITILAIMRNYLRRYVYHAADHLSKAAEHLFGKASSKANHWFTSWRHKLCHEEGAADRLLRSLAYHRGQLKKGSQRYGQVTGEMGYFRHNRDKMDYAAYQAAGLIIWAGGGGGQSHRRTPAQTQWHALDGKRRPANSHPSRSRAVQALGSILGMAPATFRPTGGRHGCVDSRLHPFL